MSSKTFSFAIDFVIGSAIGAPAATQVKVIARPLQTMVPAVLSVMYTVNITSGIDPTEICSKIQDSLDNGAFLEKLKIDTGYPITNMTNAVVTLVGNAQGDGLNPAPSTLPTTILFLNPGPQTGETLKSEINYSVCLSCLSVCTVRASATIYVPLPSFIHLTYLLPSSSFLFPILDSVSGNGLSPTVVGAIAGALTGIFVLCVAALAFFFCIRNKSVKRLTVFTSEEDDLRASGDTDVIPRCAEDVYEYPSSEIPHGR